MKLNREQYYSLLEIQKYTGIKSRQYLSRYIEEGKLLAIQTGAGGVKTRYAIRGDWAIDFMKRYKKGLVQGPFNNEQAKKLLKEALDNL